MRRLAIAEKSAPQDQRADLNERLARAREEARKRESLARKAQRQAAANGLIGHDQATRWQAAESLRSVFGKDAELLDELLRFGRQHSADQLALYNVVLVIEDLARCCQDEQRPQAATVLELLGVIDMNGGSKASANAARLRVQIQSRLQSEESG